MKTLDFSLNDNRTGRNYPHETNEYKKCACSGVGRLWNHSDQSEDVIRIGNPGNYFLLISKDLNIFSYDFVTNYD